MTKMLNRYYIEDEKYQFWCEHDFGFWSKYKHSLKDRFEGVWIYVFPLYLLMRIFGVKCKMKVI